MYSSDADLSVERFLSLPFRTLSQGGYAGMVFLLARTADAPELQRGFFEHWSDIDDLTGRPLAVFSPSPRRLRISAEHPHAPYGPETFSVSGVAEAGGQSSRLFLSSRESPGAVRMGTALPGTALRGDGAAGAAAGPAPRLVAEATGIRPHALEEHQRALTLAVSAMQRFFGIPESLVPCAVIVDMEQRSASAVTLTEVGSVYDLLKKIMTRIEHVLPHIDAADAELGAALAARHRLRDLVGRSRSPAANARASWAAQTRRLSADLEAFAERLAPAEAGLCLRMAERVVRDAPVADGERALVRAVLAALVATGSAGRLPRRLRRTLAGLNSGRPGQDQAPRRLAAARAEAAANEVRIGRVKSRLDALGRELRLGESVAGAAGEFGLTGLRNPGLREPRGLDWPLTVLGDPPPHVLSHGYERS